MAPEQAQDKPTFTDKMRGWTAPIIDPIVTLLARLGVSPNAITILGFLSHFLIAWLIATGQFRWAALATLLLAPLDALDGALARKTGQLQGNFGAFFDSTLDRLAEIVLYGGFIYYFQVYANDPLWVGVSYLAATGSLMVSYARARAESLGYEAKIGVASRVERYAILIISLALNLPQVAVALLALLTYFTFFQRMWAVAQQARAESSDIDQ